MVGVTGYKEDDFMQYLAAKLTPAAISKLRSCYNILDTYCQKNYILQKPLLQTTDPETIREVQRKVENSRALQTQYPEKYSTLVEACQYYSDYIESRPSDDTENLEAASEVPVPTPPSNSFASSNSSASPSHTGKTTTTIDFQKVYDLTGSDPKSLTYCSKPLSFGYTWTDLYVRVVLHMCKEHPQVLRPGLSFSRQHPHVELGSAADTSAMQKPRALPGTDLFVETKLTANEMLARIKYLIELCQMEYTDVVIQYKKLPTYNRPAPSQANLEPAHVKAILQQHFPHGFHTNDAADMIQFRTHYAAAYSDPLPSTDGRILSVIRKVCILSHNVAYLPGTVPMQKPVRIPQRSTLGDLLQEDRYADLRHALTAQNIKTIEELQSINLWSFMNAHNLYPIKQRLAIATELTKVLQNRSPSAAAAGTTARYAIQYGDNTYTGSTPSEAFVGFLTAIAARYPLKFRNLIGVSHPATIRIVLYRHDLAGNKLKLLNPEVFVDSDLTREQVELYIPWICSRCAIDTTFSIEECPQTEEQPVTPKDAQPPTPVEAPAPALPPEPRENTAKVFPAPETTQSPEPPLYQLLTQQAEQYLRKQDLDGASYEELQGQLHCSLPQAKTVAAQSSHIIEMNRRLYHDEAFVDFDEGADTVADILEKLLKKNGGVATAAQLWDYARAELSMFLNDNDITDQQGIYDFAKHLFGKIRYQGKHYVFSNNMYINLPGVLADSCSSVIQKYARDKGTVVTFQELEEYTKQLGVNTGNLRNLLRGENKPVFLLYAENEYILTELMHIDEAFLTQIQTALNHLFADAGDHMILRQIAANWYTLLPTLPNALAWTPLLLQQMLRYYPKKLGARTIQALDTQNSSTLHAMVVQSDSWIQDFRDAVAIYLHDQRPDVRSIYGEELRRILVEAGMIGKNELHNNMPKALSGDPRFLWNREGDTVTVRV